MTVSRNLQQCSRSINAGMLYEVGHNVDTAFANLEMKTLQLHLFQ